MNTSTYFFATITSGMVFIVSFSSSNSGQIEIELSDALKQGVVHYSSRGAGGFSGKSVILELTNSSSYNYSIKISHGTLFYPSDPGQQTLITTVDQFISLNAGSTKRETLDAFCSEHSDRSPNTSSVFSIGKNQNPKFDSLFSFLSTRKLPTSSYQDIVWAISDNSPIANVGNDSKSLRDVRRYLFKLTGQEEVDYSYDMITSVNQAGYIEQKPYQLKGYLTFNSDKTKWIHQEVYDENGKLKFKSQQAFEIPKGESDYTFNIIIKNWSTGNYTLKLKAGSEVVESYGFKV